MDLGRHLIPAGSKPGPAELDRAGVDVKGPGQGSNGHEPGHALSALQPADGADGNTRFAGQIRLAPDFPDSQLF